MGKNSLEYVVRCLGSSSEETKHFIDNKIISEDVWSLQHKRKDVRVIAKRALSFTFTALLDIVFNPCSSCYTILQHVAWVAWDANHFFSVRIEPVDRMLHILVKTIHYLTYQHVDTLFDCKCLDRPYIVWTDLNFDCFVAKIFTKTNVNNITR